MGVILASVISIDSFGQDIHLDVEGDVKVRGNIDIHHPEDSSSVFLGVKAGINNDYNHSAFPRESTFVGSESGTSNTVGFYNSFFGYQSGTSNVDGSENSFFGYESGKSNVNGEYNSFFGYESGKSNNGEGNSFFGNISGVTTSTGSFNSFFGNRSGQENSTGVFNSFFGYGSGDDNITGNENSVFGYRSGDRLKFGNYNTYIGTHSGIITSLDSLDRSIAIGYNARVGCHNCAVIGGIDEDAVKVGIGTTTPSALLHITSDNDSELLLSDTGNVVNIQMTTATGLLAENWQIKAESGPVGGAADANIIFQYGQDSLFRIKGNGNATLAGTLTENSDVRLKTNISILHSVLPQLLSLHAYTYDWKDQHKNDQRQIGLMAQQVKDAFPELIQEDENGVMSVSYTRFVPLLIEGLKEQQKQLSEHEEMMAVILEQNLLLERRLNQMDKRLPKKDGEE